MVLVKYVDGVIQFWGASGVRLLGLEALADRLIVSGGGQGS